MYCSFKAIFRGSWKQKHFNINFSTVMAEVTQKRTEKSRDFLRYIMYVPFKSYTLLISMVTVMVFNSAWSNQSSICSSVLSWISVWQTELITGSITGQISWDKTNATICENQRQLTWKCTENWKQVIFCWKLNCLLQVFYHHFY